MATKKVAPDGGWGWMACFGVSMVNLATRSIEPSFGLLFGDLLTELDVGTTGAAIIMSTLDVMMNFSGLFVGPLLSMFSYRKVSVGGSLLCALGLALTSPAASMAHILATYSVINGIGVGLATSAAFVALNHYFKDKRGQAVGLSMAGTAVGMLILPQLVRVLLESFGFRGAVLVLSALSLHATFGSMLLQPVKRHLIDAPVSTEIEMETVKPQPANGDHKAIDPPANGNGHHHNEDDDLPELKHLMFDQNKKMRKNFSDVAISSMSRVAKHPRFGRNMSVATQAPGGMFVAAHQKDMATTAVRRRRASVMSHLSALDFSGSNLHIHMNIGDDEAEKEDKAIRRVNTAMAMSSMIPMNNLSSVSKLGSVQSSTFGGRNDSGILMGPAAVEEDEPKPGCWGKVFGLLDVSLLREGYFLVLLLGLSLFYVAEMNFKMVIPFFFANLGFSKSDVALGLSIAAISDIAARVVIPPIGDRFRIKKKLIFFVSIIFVLITRSILAEQTEWTGIIVWMTISGFFRGAALANFTLCVSEACSLERLPAAFGWFLIGKAVFVVALGPLIGLIRDVTGSYPLCIHSQSVCIGLCCVVWIVEYCVDRCKSRRNQSVDPNPT